MDCGNILNLTGFPRPTTTCWEGGGCQRAPWALLGRVVVPPLLKELKRVVS